MANKRQKKFRYFAKRVMSAVSWAFLTCLVICVILLGYYFCAIKVYEKKGYGYAPVFSLYTIVSPSMVPTINVYDLIINFKVDTPLGVGIGDIITFKSSSNISKDLMITHRINDVQIVNGEYEYITKGDNNSSVDATPAQYKNIVGKTVARVPGFGKIQKFVGSMYGWMILVVIPALLILISDSVKLFKIKRIKNMSNAANSELVRTTEHK